MSNPFAAQPWKQQGRRNPWNKQQPSRRPREDDYNIYLECADDGKGGDVTRNGAPLLTYEEWMNA